MRDKPISDLRRRMIAEMTVRTFKRQDAARLYPACRDLRQISRPLARHRDQRRHPPLSAGDYVFPVKDNQKTLRQDIETAFNEPVFPPVLME